MPRPARPAAPPLAAAGSALLALAAPPSLAQEATNTPAATQPSVGHFYLRQKLQLSRLSNDPTELGREVDKIIATTTLAYGVTRTLSFSLDLPIEHHSTRRADTGERSSDVGLNDPTLTGKLRFFQHDLGPVDSIRLAAIAGVELPGGDEDLSSHSFDPIVGGVFTAILGRHGFNQAVRYKFNTRGEDLPTDPGDGRANALFYDTAYLYRLSPAEYTAQTQGATYLTLELNGLYETNGDNEILLTPGLLYEARTFALEATVGIPVHQNIDHRLERDYVVTFGVRFLF